MDKLVELCKSRDDSLSSNWRIFEYRCLPEDGDTTHIQLTGSRTTVYRRGPRKGKTKWLKEEIKTFIFSKEEYGVAIKNETR